MRAAAMILSLGMAAGVAQLAPSSTAADSLETVLQRAGAYVAAYERQLPAIVAEEDYTQRFMVEPGSEIRHLRSDLLTIQDEADGWIGFRDVYEVDGRPVRDRTDRLAKLFLEPHQDPRAQAKRIADESARFNLARQVSRTINTPLLALQFIRPQNQGRSRFRAEGKKVTRGLDIRIVGFQEHAIPRIIRTVDDAAARGRFWIEAGSGRITQTELFVNTGPRVRFLSALIQVAYAEQPRLQMWLPVSMDETYQGSGLIDGHATYSNFHKFSVATDTTIKAP